MIDMPVIVISGKPGCGSSTVAKLLAKRLKLKHFSVGDYNKAHAKKAKKETDKSLEMWKLNKKSLDSFHLKSDKIARQFAQKGNIAIDAKLGIRMIKGLYDYSIWLTASKPVRARRYAKRDTINTKDATKKLAEKENLERENWKRIYGFDYFAQEKEADIAVNTGDKTPDEITDLIVSKIRRVFIVHGWEATPSSDWYPYVKRELEKRGFLVYVLRMPDTNKPQLKSWLLHLAKSIGKPSENTFLIGHSAGVATILRHLEGLKKGETIGGCVLVAGWIDDLGYKQLSSFVQKPFNWPKIRKHCRKFVAIHSDNDPFVKMYHGKAFQKSLKAKLIVEHNKGHLTDEEGIRKLKSVVTSIVNFS